MFILGVLYFIGYPEKRVNLNTRERGIDTRRLNTRKTLKVQFMIFMKIVILK